MRDHLIVLAVAVSVTAASTPLVRRLALRIGAVVEPDERRVHEVPTPTIGGLAMFVGMLAGLAAAWRLPTYSEMFSSSSETLGVAVAGVIVVGVGLLDDLREVSAPAKVAGQVLAASVLYLLGVTLLFFRIPFGDVVLLGPDLAPLVTVLWVVLMVNAVNLIDGLDGLAAGLVAIAAAAFFLYSSTLADDGLIDTTNPGPLVALVVLGVCLGFLPFNVHPARVFMGDTGALLLGLLMAASTIAVGGRANDQFAGQVYFFFAPIVIPFVIMGVAVFDTLFAVVRRARRGARLTDADKGHLHHRLLRLGHGHRRAVLIMWSWTLLLSAVVLVPSIGAGIEAIAALLVLGAALLVATVAVPRWRRRPSELKPPSPTA